MLTLARIRVGFVLALATVCSLAAAQTPEYRAQWADAFHTAYLTPEDLTATVAALRAANLNVFVPEVGVSTLVYWNPTPSEYPDLGSSGVIVSNGIPISCDLNSEPDYNFADPYDPLGSTILECHDTSGGKARLDVWAWLVSFSPSGAVQSEHPSWITVNPDSSYQSDLDPGHPGVAQELLYKCLDIVKHYDVDGLNFDFVRFTNVNNGYNPISIARYNAIKGKTGTPNTGDAGFKQWRRDQITNLMRKVYLNVIAVKPNVKISVDAVTWTPSPTPPTAGDPNPLQTWKNSFQSNSGAYTGTYQDWRGWLEEGIIDIAMPMAYFRECANKVDYDKWSDFTKDNQFGRQCVIGPGGYLNALSDALAQLTRTRQPSSTMHKYAAGQNNYSFAGPYAATCGGTTQWYSSGLRDALVSGMYSQPVSVPALPRLTNGKGHVMGTVVSSLVAAPGWVDGGTVTLSVNEDGSSPLRTMSTDGTGFYGFVDVPPGPYFVKVRAKGNGYQIKPVTVASGTVSIVDFTLGAPPPATQLAFSVQPDGAVGGYPFTVQPVVRALDSTGAQAESYTGPVTLSIKAGAGTPGAVLSGSTTVNAVNGIATFSGVSIDRPGADYVLTAGSGTLATADSGPFTVVNPPARLVFVQQPAGAAALKLFATQPTVAAVDDIGNVVQSFSAPVTIQIKAGSGITGGQLSGTPTRSAVKGVATYTDLSISKAGTGYVLTASTSGLVSAESEAFDVAVVPTQLKFTTSPAGAVAGRPLAPRPVVTATDDDGNAAVTFEGQVTLSIKDGTGVSGASLNGTLTVNALNGAASFDGLSIDQMGYGFRLHAVSAALKAADSYAFDVSSSAVGLAFETQPGGARSGLPFARQPVVVARNADGGTATDYEGPVDLMIRDGTGSAFGWLDGNASVTMIKGIGTFTDLVINGAGAGYVLTASSGTLPSMDSAAFDVVDGRPYTFADAIRVLTVAGGLAVSTPDDEARYDMGISGGVGLVDAVVIARKVAGLEANP